MASCAIIHISIKNDSHLGIRLFHILHIEKLYNILVNYNTSLIIFQNVMVYLLFNVSESYCERHIGAFYSKEKNSLSSYILIECSITLINSQIV